MALAFIGAPRLFSRADLGPHGVVNLLRIDGASLMRVPFDPAQVGTNFFKSANFQRILRSTIEDVHRQGRLRRSRPHLQLQPRRRSTPSDERRLR